MCAFATMGRCSSAARYEAQKNGRLALPQSCIVVTCKSSGTYTAGGYAVNIRHEATLPRALEAAVRRTPQTGIQTTCLKDSHFWLACVR